MKAIILGGEAGKAELVHDRPYPSLRPGYLTVDVKAVALNPTDWKQIDLPALNTAKVKGCLSGCDYAGVVAEIGPDAKSQWAVGDRICGFAAGGNQHQPDDGAFAERIVVKADVQIRIPEGMSFEEAAALGVGVFTCGQGLFQQMGLSFSALDEGTDGQRGKSNPVMIYGGGTATGTLGIQFLRLAGYTPITTCSPRNFEHVKALGAFEAFDYNDPECVTKIKRYAPSLQYIWDTISSPSSRELCSEVIAAGGTYGGFAKDAEFPRSDVKTTFSLGYTVFGEPVTKGSMHYTDTSKDFEFAKRWVVYVQKVLDEGKLQTVPIDVRSGLENVMEGLAQLQKGEVSGKKLVYRL